MLSEIESCICEIQHQLPTGPTHSKQIHFSERASTTFKNHLLQYLYSWLPLIYVQMGLINSPYSNQSALVLSSPTIIFYQHINRCILWLQSHKTGNFRQQSGCPYYSLQAHLPKVDKKGFSLRKPIPGCLSYWMSNANGTRISPSAYSPNIHTARLMSFGSPILNALVEVITILGHLCERPSFNKQHHATPLRVLPPETLTSMTHP